MNKINTFQDLLREEFDIEDTILEDEILEDGELLDIVITNRDYIKTESMDTGIEEFIEELDEQTNQIIKIERESAMEDLYDFFDEDAQIFEETIDYDIDEIEEVEDPSFDDELDFIDNMEGLPEIGSDEPFSNEMEEY